MTLRDMNTVSMVAEHWSCSPRTVRNRIAEGALPCLRLGGVVRITRQQVEGFELACTSGNTKMESGTSALAHACAAGDLRAQRIAGKPRSTLVVLSRPLVSQKMRNAQLGKP